MNFMEIKSGKQVRHSTGGKYKIIGFTPKSRTMVEIEDIDRGAGWDEDTQTYIGVKTKGGWFRGENKGFGDRHIVHRKTLTPIQ